MSSRFVSGEIISQPTAPNYLVNLFFRGFPRTLRLRDKNPCQESSSVPDGKGGTAVKAELLGLL